MLRKHTTMFVLCTALCIGAAGCSSATAEPQHTRRAQLEADLAELNARLTTGRDYLAEHDAHQERLAEEWNAETQKSLARVSEAAELSYSMRRHLESTVPGRSDVLAKRLSVDAFAILLVEEVNIREEAGRWLPLGRRKAPAFLASVAFHESGWRWRNPDLRGSRGEGCAFQVAPTTSRLIGYDPDEVARRPLVCVRAALDAMEYCAKTCGDVPAEGWLGCYGTGTCGGAPEVIEKRFALARTLYRTDL